MGKFETRTYDDVPLLGSDLLADIDSHRISIVYVGSPIDQERLIVMMVGSVESLDALEKEYPNTLKTL